MLSARSRAIVKSNRGQEGYNLSNSAFTSALFEGWVPSGYAPEYPLDYTTPPFAAENIAIVSVTTHGQLLGLTSIS